MRIHLRGLALVLCAAAAQAGDYEICYLDIGGKFYGLGGAGGKLIISWGSGFWLSPIPDRPFVAAIVYWPVTMAVAIGAGCAIWWWLRSRSMSNSRSPA